MPRLDLETLRRIGAEKMLREEWPDITDDELADNLEGLTDFNEACSHFVRKAGEDEATVDALKTYIASLQARQARLQARVEAARGFLARAMDATGTKKLELPEATLSMREGRVKVIVTDEDLIPDYFFDEKITRTLNKINLTAAFADGSVSGAELSNAEPILTIRRK